MVLPETGRLCGYCESVLVHILWNNKFELFDRTFLMLYYKLLGKRAVFTAHNAGKRDQNNSWLVAIAFSACGPLIRLPVSYFIVGRCGPVRTADLWMTFFRHLPLWIVVFFVTWLTRSLIVDLTPLAQLLVCAPVAVIVGVTFICSFSPQRQLAIHLFETLRELKKAR